MTKTQIEYLYLLGYKDTQEDGALLEHKFLIGTDAYVWTDDTFRDVLFMYPNRLAYAVKREAASKILTP